MLCCPPTCSNHPHLASCTGESGGVCNLVYNAVKQRLRREMHESETIKSVVAECIELARSSSQLTGFLNPLLPPASQELPVLQAAAFTNQGSYGINRHPNLGGLNIPSLSISHRPPAQGGAHLHQTHPQGRTSSDWEASASISPQLNGEQVLILQLLQHMTTCVQTCLQNGVECSNPLCQSTQNFMKIQIRAWGSIQHRGLGIAQQGAQGMAQHGMAQQGIMQQGMAQHGMMQQVIAQQEIVRQRQHGAQGIAQHGVVQQGLTPQEIIQQGIVQQEVMQHVYRP